MMSYTLRAVTTCATAFNVAVMSLPLNPGPGVTMDEGTLAASPTDDTHLLLEYSVTTPAPPAPTPAPGELWQGWGIIPHTAPAESCEGFFANIPREIISLAAPKTNPQPEDPIDALPAGELAYRALALAKIDGAGLQVQPHSRAYVGVPTLVHATNPQRSATVELLGHPVHVSFTASSYSYSFDDGSAPLVATAPSGPFPISRLRHIYQEAFPSQTITLETIRSAHITHPTNGQIITLNNAFNTRETSLPFEVRKARGHLTDTAEEPKGR